MPHLQMHTEITILDQLHPWIQPAAQDHDENLWAEFHGCKVILKFAQDDYNIGLTGDAGSDESLKRVFNAHSDWMKAKEKLVNWYGSSQLPPTTPAPVPLTASVVNRPA